MLSIYGVKTLTEGDIFNHCGRPNALKDTIYNKFEEITDLLDEEDKYLFVKIDSTLQRVEFNIEFIPLELVEEYIKFNKEIEAIDSICNAMVTEDKVIKLQQDKENVKKMFLEKVKAYDKNIMEDTCVAVLLDKQYGGCKNIISYYICNPRKIITLANKMIKYECCHCGKTIKCSTEVDDMPDEWYYTVVNLGIDYYCPECNEEISKRRVHVRTVHVGDTFFRIK